jgi:hypothetical protein
MGCRQVAQDTVQWRMLWTWGWTWRFSTRWMSSVAGRLLASEWEVCPLELAVDTAWTLQDCWKGEQAVRLNQGSNAVATFDIIYWHCAVDSDVTVVGVRSFKNAGRVRTPPPPLPKPYLLCIFLLCVCVWDRCLCVWWRGFVRELTYNLETVCVWHPGVGELSTWICQFTCALTSVSSLLVIL